MQIAKCKISSYLYKLIFYEQVIRNFDHTTLEIIPMIENAELKQKIDKLILEYQK